MVEPSVFLCPRGNNRFQAQVAENHARSLNGRIEVARSLDRDSFVKEEAVHLMRELKRVVPLGNGVHRVSLQFVHVRPVMRSYTST